MMKILTTIYFLLGQLFLSAFSRESFVQVVNLPGQTNPNCTLDTTSLYAGISCENRARNRTFQLYSS